MSKFTSNLSSVLVDAKSHHASCCTLCHRLTCQFYLMLPILPLFSISLTFTYLNLDVYYTQSQTSVGPSAWHKPLLIHIWQFSV